MLPNIANMKIRPALSYMAGGTTAGLKSFSESVTSGASAFWKRGTTAVSGGYSRLASINSQSVLRASKSFAKGPLKAAGMPFYRGGQGLGRMGMGIGYGAKQAWKHGGAFSPMGSMAQFGLVGGAFLGAGKVLATIGIAKGIQAAFGRKASAVAPGTKMTSGKRGIDANNLNASGVGLAMHRNRRSF